MSETISTEIHAKPGDETWSVMVLYENKPTRDRAMRLCDRLMKNFWSEVEFDFHWWRTDFLDDPRMAQTAAAAATNADIFIFSSAPETGLSPMFLNWLTSWSGGREAREGMFLDLSDAMTQASRPGEEKQARLREVAARAHLDYFNRIPPLFSGTMPNSPESVDARAHQVTSILDDILHRLPPPTHFGLNE